MSGTIFDKSSGTFADELGVENIYDEDMQTEGQDEDVEAAALELNPPLSKPKEWDLVSPLASAENSGLIKAYTELDSRVTAMGRKLHEVSELLEKLFYSLKVEDEVLADEDEDLEPEDLEEYQPQKKGSPGRPAKQPPKIVVPKKQKAKPVVKKPAKAKPKAAKAKPKSRKR